MGILRLVKCIIVDTSVLLRCHFTFLLPIFVYCSPVWGSAAEYQLFRCIRWKLRLCPDLSFLSLCHRRHVAGLSMLYKVNLNSNHCLFSEFPSASTRVGNTTLWLEVIRWSLKYHGVERPYLLGISCRLRFECGMTFRTLCLTPERWIGSRVPSKISTLKCYCDP